MKDHAKTDLEANRPKEPARHCVEYCLEQLYKDKTRQLTDVCAGDLTYEELIGALLSARDEIVHAEELAELDTVSFHTTEIKAAAFEQSLLGLIESSRHDHADSIVKIQWSRTI